MGNVTTNITKHIREFIGGDGQRYTTLEGAKYRQEQYRVKNQIPTEIEGESKEEVIEQL